MSAQARTPLQELAPMWPVTPRQASSPTHEPVTACVVSANESGSVSVAQAETKTRPQITTLKVQKTEPAKTERKQNVPPMVGRLAVLANRFMAVSFGEVV